MRSENQAILVGANTVLLDNPTLTVRNWSGKSPVRIAIDRQGRIPENYNILDGSIPTLVFTEKDKLSKNRVEFIKINFDADNLKTILNEIYHRNINSIMVEGGASIINSFIEAGLWDEANIEVSPVKITDGVKAPVLDLQPVSRDSFEGHEWLFYKK